VTELPSLVTERLAITLLQPAAAEPAAAYAAANRAYVAPWSPRRGDDYYSHDFWAVHAEQSLEEWRSGRSARFVLSLASDPACVIGECNLTEIARGYFESCYLGFSLHHRHTGRGLMTEALSALLAFAFQEMRLHRVSANYLPDNLRSERLLRRLGFRKEGLAPAYLFINGAWRDHVLTSLANPDPGFLPALAGRPA
jgi:[ribosomal protein S5]-alanine N-acetyltransferase